MYSTVLAYKEVLIIPLKPGLSASGWIWLLNFALEVGQGGGER
jgi:hypothetical protein